MKVKYIGEYLREMWPYGMVAEVEEAECDGQNFFHYIDEEGQGWAWMPDEVELIEAE